MKLIGQDQKKRKLIRTDNVYFFIFLSFVYLKVSTISAKSFNGVHISRINQLIEQLVFGLVLVH